MRSPTFPRRTGISPRYTLILQRTIPLVLMGDLRRLVTDASMNSNVCFDCEMGVAVLRVICRRVHQSAVQTICKSEADLTCCFFKNQSEGNEV